MSMTIQSSVKDKILVTSSKTSKECEIRYHPGKANGVADALSRKAIWSRSTDPDQVNSVSSYTRRLQDVKFARIYIDEIVARNEILVMINSADGQSGCMVQTLGDIMRACVIDFGGSYHSSIRCTPFEALYGRKLVLTKEKLKAARDRQKSNTDKGRKLLEFKVGDWVMLKVSPWKGVIHFGKKGKLALRYVGPFQILEGIGPAAYSVDKTLRLVEEPIEIGDYKVFHENLKLITDERVIDDKPESHSGSMSSMKNLDDTFNFGDQFLHDKPTEDDQEKSKVREESDSTIPDPSQQTVTSTPPVIAPFTDVSSTKPSSLVTPPPINTEATTITTSLPEITPFIALQLRVARLEQEMSEVKKTDHQADILERHTADLIEKYSVLPGPESVKNQESEKSPKEIIRAKKEQDEEKQDSTYSIRSTDKVDLEEFDLKSALFNHMNKNKSANRNTANYHLYHALMEALITDEDAIDKEVADKGKSSKRRRHDSGASGSAQPPTKDDEQSSKKPRESDASASKQHPALTSTGWQITDTRDAGADSSMHRSDPESEHSEQSSENIPMQDEGNELDMADTDSAYIPKVLTTTWFKPIPESERPDTPEPEWTIPPNDFPEPENNWANTYATTYKVPEENKLQRKTYDIGSFIKWFCRRTGKKKLCKADLEGPAFNLVKAFHKNSVFLQYQMDECHKLLTNKVDLSNPEGHQIPQNIYDPLPLGGPPGQVTIQPQFFFNKDLDYLLTGDKERKIALSISKLKAARYLDFGLEELVPSLWVESEREYDISAVYGITHWWFRRKEFYINKHSESSDREAVRSQMRILSVISVKVFEKYGYNYLREIILRRADYQEYKISEKDFKNLHPNDFEDLFLLNIQEKLNHLPKTDKTSLHTVLSSKTLLKPA
ncbi:hypothetical protein Tco_1518148 [Tanacetum coccineum]